MNELQKEQSEIAEAQAKLNAAQARIEELSKPVEREYRAGEWVPAEETAYFVNDENGITFDSENINHPYDKYRIKNGNAYPTEAIAEAAKEHADWWSEFDMTDEGGDFYICVNKDNDIRVCECDRIADGTPRYKNEMIARAAIERLGGEQKVIEMLKKGRVFRFKWGGQ